MDIFAVGDRSGRTVITTVPEVGHGDQGGTRGVGLLRHAGKGAHEGRD